MKVCFSLLLTAATIFSPIVLSPISDSTPAQAQTNKSADKQYRVGNLSFNAPSHWINYSSSQDDITLFNQKIRKRGGGLAPKNMIKLTAGIIPQDLETAIRPQPMGMEKTVLKTESLTINGRKTVREYDYDKGVGDFPHSVITYVQTSRKQTTVIVIFYTSSNPYAEKFIKQINDSISVR